MEFLCFIQIHMANVSLSLLRMPFVLLAPQPLCFWHPQKLIHILFLRKIFNFKYVVFVVSVISFDVDVFYCSNRSVYAVWCSVALNITKMFCIVFQVSYTRRI